MSNEFWGTWEKENVDNARPSNKSSSWVAISENMQRPVLKCYEYFCNNGKKYSAFNETAKALKLCKRSVERTAERGKSQ